jgi:hypothetical protein
MNFKKDDKICYATFIYNKEDKLVLEELLICKVINSNIDGSFVKILQIYHPDKREGEFCDFKKNEEFYVKKGYGFESHSKLLNSETMHEVFEKILSKGTH